MIITIIIISLILKLSTTTYSSSNKCRAKTKKRIQIYNFKITNGNIKSHMRNRATLASFI